MNIKNKEINNVYVYQHLRLDKNEVFYIGIGNKKKLKRAYCKSNRNKHWNNITDKHDYKVEILHENLSWNLACEIEIHLIKFYGRRDLGAGSLVNMTNGGDGSFGAVFSEERRNQIRVQNTGKIRSKETREKISKNQLLSGNNKGIKNQMYGRKGILSPNFGKNLSEETKEKLRKKAKLRIISEETKIKMSINSKGKNNRLILSTNTGIYYNGIQEASIVYNIPYSTLSSYLNERYKNKTDLIYV